MHKKQMYFVEGLYRIGRAAIKGWEDRKNTCKLRKGMKKWTNQSQKAEDVLKQYGITVTYHNFQPLYKYGGEKSFKLKEIVKLLPKSDHSKTSA